MNVAAFNVVVMNIPHIIECSSPDSATFDILFCLFRTWSFVHNFCCVTARDEIFGICLFLVIHCLRFPRSIVNRLSVPCGMRIPAEKRFLTMRVDFFAIYPKNLPQVSLIDRAPQLHFSTLEKTKIDHNPLLNNLVVTSSQVSPIVTCNRFSRILISIRGHPRV